MRKMYPLKATMSSQAPLAAADEATMETREASPAHFLFKIDSFSLLDEHGIDTLETREFESGGYKWRLTIYPNGHGTAGKNGEDYVSAYLAMSDTSALPSNWEVNAVFSICLFNHTSGNYLYALGRARRFHALKPEWGFDKFVSRKSLTDPSNGYLIDDKCVFGAEVFVNENNAETERLSVNSVDNDPYKHGFEISNFSTLKMNWFSDEFTFEGHTWKIEVYPNGKGKATGRSLSVFLRHVVPSICDLSERVMLHYTVRIKDQSSGHHHHQLTGSDRWFSASGSKGWGWPSFIKLSSLNDPNKGFIVKDCCVLEIELAVQAISW